MIVNEKNFFRKPQYKNQQECEIAELYCDNELSYINRLANASDPLNKDEEEKFLDSVTREKDIRKMPLFTKRQALSLIAKVFDILGLISPFLLVGKLIMQATWSEPNCSWDKILPTHLQIRMQAWAAQLYKLHSFSIPRCIAPNAGKITDLVTLVDASLAAMSAVCYAVSVEQCGIRGHLFFAICNYI